MHPLAILTATALLVPSAPGNCPHPTLTDAHFEKYSETAKAVTYDDAVPVGAHITVSSVPTHDGKTEVTLVVRGLKPSRDYGAHAHLKKCGADANDSGGHYQNEPDPTGKMGDPKYSNPKNEIWLDFTTDAKGGATSHSVQQWQFTDRHAQSVVIHAERTKTGPGEAGMAGARIGCTDVDF